MGFVRNEFEGFYCVKNLGYVKGISLNWKVISGKTQLSRRFVNGIE